MGLILMSIKRIKPRNIGCWMADQVSRKDWFRRLFMQRSAWGAFSIYSHIKRSNEKPKIAYPSKSKAENAAVDMAKTDWILAFVSLLTAILILTLGKGLLKLVPIIGGVVVGFIVALAMGKVDLSMVAEASWFSIPFRLDTITHFEWAPFLYMIPVAIAPVIEHIGDVYTVGAVAEKDFVKDPGLHRTMLGDGLACLASAFLGGPPETTYSEVTGAMSITKITSPRVIRISAATAIVFSVIGKLSALLQSIPQAVLGGIMLLLFGTIANVGIQTFVRNKVDLNETRNVIISSVMLTMGLGGAVLSSGNFAISGIGLSAVVGIILNLVLPKKR